MKRRDYSMVKNLGKADRTSANDAERGQLQAEESGERLTATEHRADRQDVAEATRSGGRRVGLRVMSGIETGHEILLHHGENPVALPVASQVVVDREPKGCFLRHLDEVGPVRVNGVAVGAFRSLLRDGDIVEIGSTYLLFFTR